MAFRREPSTQKLPAKRWQSWVRVQSLGVLVLLAGNANAQGRILAVRPTHPVADSEGFSSTSSSSYLPTEGSSLPIQVRVTGFRPAPPNREEGHEAYLSSHHSL